MINKNNIFQCNHLFINYKFREKNADLFATITCVPKMLTWLNIYLATLDSEENFVLIAIPVKASRQAPYWPYQ